MKKITIEYAAYKWFDMKLSIYDELKTDHSIYLYYEGHEYAEIAIYKRYQTILFDPIIWKEFNDMFPMGYSEFKEVISKWVGDTFNLMGFTSLDAGTPPKYMLEIPK